MSQPSLDHQYDVPPVDEGGGIDQTDNDDGRKNVLATDDDDDVQTTFATRQDEDETPGSDNATMLQTTTDSSASLKQNKEEDVEEGATKKGKGGKRGKNNGPTAKPSKPTSTAQLLEQLAEKDALIATLTEENTRLKKAKKKAKKRDLSKEPDPVPAVEPALLDNDDKDKKEVPASVLIRSMEAMNPNMTQLAADVAQTGKPTEDVNEAAVHAFSATIEFTSDQPFDAPRAHRRLNALNERKRADFLQAGSLEQYTNLLYEHAQETSQLLHISVDVLAHQHRKMLRWQKRYEGLHQRFQQLQEEHRALLPEYHSTRSKPLASLFQELTFPSDSLNNELLKSNYPSSPQSMPKQVHVRKVEGSPSDNLFSMLKRTEASSTQHQREQAQHLIPLYDCNNGGVIMSDTLGPIFNRSHLKSLRQARSPGRNLPNLDLAVSNCLTTNHTK